MTYLTADTSDIATSCIRSMENLWLYGVLVFGIIVLPGMDMAFVLASTISGGRKSGFAAVIGMVTGGFVHVVMSALGIGLLLKLFPALFNVMLTAGCAYVAWIGYSIMRHAGKMSSFGDVKPSEQTPLLRTYIQAIVTCLLNPKAYLFMFAVFPQFLKTDTATFGPIWSQALALFVIGAMCQTVIYGMVAIAASQVKTRLSRGSSSQMWFARGVGAVLIVTASWTLVSAWI
jgi:threonine/homoserine/homoserine lactone efflux protein